MYSLALVTGASSGLGKALCRKIAEKKIPLILVARNEEALRETASELTVKTHLFPADLSLLEERARLIEFIRREKPDLVINNAGFGLYGPALGQPLPSLIEMVELNAKAPLELSLESARTLAQAGKKGTILNVSSAAAFFSYPNLCTYAATKAFLNSFSQGLDAELKSQGIRVLTACPGQFVSSFRMRASNHFPQKKSPLAMSSDTVATQIIRQIEKGRRLTIIDWRYRLLHIFAKVLPTRTLHTFLSHTLKGRYRH